MEKRGRGREKKIEKPEDLFAHFQNYKKWVDENPIVKKITGNKDFIISNEKLRRPLTLEGFENWCYDNDIIKDLGDYFKNKDERYSDFTPICSYIKRKIRQDQIEGGMVGVYNSSITQRLNGLVEKTQTEVSGSTEINIVGKKFANEDNAE